MMTNKILILFLGITIIFGGCNYLESEEFLHEVDDVNNTFETRKDLRENWTACFGSIPINANYYHSNLFGMADEFYPGLDDYASLSFGRGLYSADKLVGATNVWGSAYLGIRRCNIFMVNAPNCEDEALELNELDEYINDIRFVRVFLHSLLFEHYGPIVIADRTIDYSKGNYETNRLSIDKSVEWMVSELDELISLLPEQSDLIQENFGRPTKATAMATKAKILLLQASPLFNGNPDYTSFVNPEGEQLFPPTVDLEKWRSAADAYKEIIDLGKYDLYTVPANDGYATIPLGDFVGNDVAYPNGPAGIDPYRSYKGLFTGGDDYWNEEVIWQLPMDTQLLTAIGWPRSTRDSDQFASNAFAPRQKLVDAFYMNNGQSISEATTLYNDISLATTGDDLYIKGVESELELPIQTNFLAAANASAPVPARVLNREARFYAIIGFTGRGYQYNGDNPYYYANFSALQPDGYIQTNRPSTRTGYSFVKWLADEDTYPRNGKAKQYPYFRMAEVFLGYAEALNEYDPGNAEILTYLNRVRFRAGLPGVAETDQSLVRAIIKQERHIEFAGEVKRYTDMRRWKDAANPRTDQNGNTIGFGGSVRGQNYLATDGQFYDRFKIDSYTFRLNQYFLPLPYAEVANHWGTIQQNPGW